MAKVRFLKGTEEKIESAPVQDGAILVSDTGKMFVDNASERSRVGVTYKLSKSGNNITLAGDDGSSSTVTDSNTVYGNATSSAAGLMSAADKTKLDSIASGAQANQNAFSNVAVGATTVAADSATDTLTLAAGSNVTITPDATNDKITIAATNTTYSAATSSAAGLMSAADKSKLDGIAAGANAYSLPTASDSTKGGILTGYTSSGKNYAVDVDADGKAFVNVPWTDTNTNTDTTYSLTKSGSTITLTGSDGKTTSVTDANTTYSAGTGLSLSGTTFSLGSVDASKITGTIAAANLPSYVDDVLEYNGTANFPETGEAGKIYVDTATNKTYRWSGTAYTEISASLALGTTSSTAYRGDYGDTAYQHATAKGSAFSSGLYKITTNAQGHVTAATAVTKADITALGIPGSDTNTTYSAMKGATTDAAGTSGLTPAPTAGAANRYLRSDGTWSVPPDTNTTYSAATTSAAGLMSASDKSKLDGIASGANAYTLPTASASVKGGITLGYAASGKNYPVALDTNGKAYVNVPWTDNNTTYSTGTASTAGLTKLYTGTGTATDGTMTQAAINTALSGKASSSHNHDSAYVKLSGSAITGKITRSAGGSNISARDNVAVSGLSSGQTAGQSYNPVIGQKTTSGYWSIGNLSGDEKLQFQYTTDANYEAGTNSCVAVSLPNTAGTVALTSQIPSVGNGTITITQNGTSKGTFTTNQSGNTTIALTDNNTTYSAMGAATASAAGTSGLVPAPAAGKQTSFLRGDGTWVVPTNTTYSNMTGATTSAAGKAGLVPAPAAGAATRYLRSDGTWQVPPDTNTNTTYSAGTGLTLSGTTFSLSSSGVAAGSYGPTANVTGSEGTTINVPQITVDAYGRVTAVTNRVLTNKNTDTNTDTKVTISASNPASTTTYYPTFAAGAATGGVNYNNGIAYLTNEGTTSAAGLGLLQLGNSTASGKAGNKSARLRMYGTTAYYTDYYPPNAAANASRYMVGRSSNAAVGSATQPVYAAADGTLTACTAYGSASVASAAKLTTARTINGTSFDGSAAITTANWGTARTLTIGSTGKSVNGSANVSWSLAEIGAAAASHTHSNYAASDIVTVSSTQPTSSTCKLWIQI